MIIRQLRHTKLRFVVVFFVVVDVVTKEEGGQIVDDAVRALEVARLPVGEDHAVPKGYDLDPHVLKGSHADLVDVGLARISDHAHLLQFLLQPVGRDGVLSHTHSAAQDLEFALRMASLPDLATKAAQGYYHM